MSTRRTYRDHAMPTRRSYRDHTMSRKRRSYCKHLMSTRENEKAINKNYGIVI
jgi:hypothetical protein